MRWDYEYAHDRNFWRFYCRIIKIDKESNILAVDWERREALIDRPWEAWFQPRVIKW